MSSSTLIRVTAHTHTQINKHNKMFLISPAERGRAEKGLGSVILSHQIAAAEVEVHSQLPPQHAASAQAGSASCSALKVLIADCTPLYRLLRHLGGVSSPTLPSTLPRKPPANVKGQYLVV